MPVNLCFTIRFLQPYSHGRGNDGEPEWPPSPLRMFQALIAAAAGRWNERIRLEYAVPALRWLERQSLPTIVAASGVRSDAMYRLFVPDNVADKVARSWSARREASIADYRTEKDVCTTRLLGDVVHYLFPIAESDPEFEPHRNTLIDAARSITHLGWGVDMVVGNAAILSEEDAARLTGERWRPAEEASASRLRVPKKGTFDDLMAKHAALLNRLSEDYPKPVAPPTVFRIIGYRRDTDFSPGPFTAFTLLTPDAERFRAFDTVRRSYTVAAMLRHAAGQAAALYRPHDRQWRDTFVLGHSKGSNRPATTDERFAYLPLPTIEERKANGQMNAVVGSIRRVLVVEPPGGSGQEVAWVRQRLSGQPLMDEATRQPTATLALIPNSDRRLRWYIGPARVWSTVTPVILPGFDDQDNLRRKLHANRDADQQKKLLDRLNGRIEKLLGTALEHAGFSAALREKAILEYRPVGFRPGLDLAKRYRVSSHHPFLPRYHVRITWSVPVRGPVCLGTGRYYGMGLFATETSPSG